MKEPMSEFTKVLKAFYVRLGLPGTSLNAGLRNLLKKDGQVHEEAPRLRVDLATARLAEKNEEALSQRLFLDPDYEFDNTELWPDVVEVLGFEAAQETMREYWETFDAYHVEIDEVIHADDGRVVNVVRDGGRMRGTDAEVWNRFFHVWTLRDGRIVRLSIHTDRNRSLEAAGLSE